MLLLDSGFEVGGVSLFRDHVDPGTVHHLPGRPRLTGPDALSLQVFRGDAAGALLRLEVDLAHPDGTLEHVRDELGQRWGAVPQLVPVLFDQGTVRLTTLGVAAGTDPAAPGRLVERVWGTAVPSLLGQGRAAFVVRLDAEGAAAVQASLEQRALPATVVYDLAYRGLRPASGLRIELDQAMAYATLAQRLGVDTLWFDADVAGATEDLRRDGRLRVTDVDYTGSDPMVLAARRAAAEDAEHELVTTVFFQPAATPAAAGGSPAAPLVDAAWSAQGRARVGYVLRAVRQDEEQHATYDRSEASVEHATSAPQGALDVPVAWDPATAVRTVDLAAPDAPQEVAVAVVDGADWSGVAALQVDVRGTGDVRSVVLDPAHPGPGTLVLPAGPLERAVTVLADPLPGDLGTPPASTPLVEPLDGTTIWLDPAALARRRTVEVCLGVVAPDVVHGAAGRLVAGAATGGTTTEHAFVLDASRPGVEVAVWGDVPLSLEAELATSAGPIALSTALAPGTSTALLNLPREEFQQVTVALADPLSRYHGVDVELAAGTGPHGSVSVDAAAPTGTWARVRQADDPPGFRFRTSRLHADGVVERDDWTDATGSLLVVGDAELLLAEVTVVLVGWSDVVGALLSLTSADVPPGVVPRVEAFLQAAPWQATLRLPTRRGSALGYRVDAQVFLADEVRTLTRPGESAQTLLVTPAWAN